MAERAEETLRVIDAQQPAVQELKWQLVSYTAMLGSKAESERAELIPLHRAAVRMLAEVPCDLPEARRAVDRFVAAVHTSPEGEAP
ncbi:hypothetical protein ACFQ2Y_28945 [Streptomyces malaysiensis subsp. malaysiensis]